MPAFSRLGFGQAADALPAVTHLKTSPRIDGTTDRFRRARDGSVAILFALLLVPLAVFVGATVDYSRATDAHAVLAAAADAAALSAVNPQAMGIKKNDAKKSAEDLFRARAGTLPHDGAVAVKVDVDEKDGRRNVRVAYSLLLPTTFMRMTGRKTIEVAGASTASSADPVYIDFHLLLDNTPSMGVGATLADIATMVNNTSDKCAFACHDLSANGNDYYAKAKKLGVTMRIDVVRSATQRLMDTATNTAIVKSQFRAAVYTFGTSCAALGLATVSALSDNLSGVKSAANNIDLMTIPKQNYNNDQCTDYDNTIAAADKAIGASGDGASAAHPQQMLFFVADGVADAYYPSTCSRPTTGGRCQEPLKPKDCQALKDRGVKIAVLYTTYLPLPTNSWYQTWIAPFAPKIGTNMEACASPGLYFEVSPSQGIAEAMEVLFKRAVSQARVTS